MSKYSSARSVFQDELSFWQAHISDNWASKTENGIFPHFTKVEFKRRKALNHNLQIPNRELLAHWDHAATHYYWCSTTADYIFPLIDIDIGKAQGMGTVEGGQAFAWHLQKLYPGLYVEPSTNGNGQHAYPKLYVKGLDASQRNHLLKKLQAYLVSEAERVGADVELVEVKGHCPTTTYGILTFGQWAKTPRELPNRFQEFVSTATITPDMIPEQPKNKKSSSVGSVVWFTDDDKALLKPLTQEFKDRGLDNLPTSSRAKVSAEDFAVTAIIAAKISKEEVEAMPTRRIEAVWRMVVQSGITSRGFDTHRWKVIRNKLSELGLLNWSDNTYVPPTIDQFGDQVRGRCMVWTFGGELLEFIRGVQERERNFAGTQIPREYSDLPPLKGKGEYLLPCSLLKVTPALPEDWEERLEATFAMAG